MASLLDIFFFIFHILIILFNLLGWIWQKTRKWNLAILLLTGFSWLILGIWYGLGYCPFTEWHWQVRQKLGYHDMPASYIKFLIKSLTGIDLNARLVDIITLVFFLAALIISVFLNKRDWLRRRGK